MAEAIFELSVSDAVDRIRAVNGRINAYVSTRFEDALTEAAAKAGEALRNCPMGPACGSAGQYDQGNSVSNGISIG